MHGQFCWYELTTPDVEASKRFYPRFTGWGTQAFDKDYTVWTDGGVPIGGIFRLNDQMQQQGVPPNWMPYVETDNVDETAKKAKSLGGKVVAGPDDIPGTGRFAVLQDPQGATFGIYKSARDSGGWNGKAVVGRFSWHELMTTDYVKAFEFYNALFGWNKTGEMDMGGGNMYRLFGQGEAQYGGMFNRTPDMQGMHPFWLVYIHVDDVSKAVEIAMKNGAFVQRERMEIPGGTIAILGDPQGAAFALHDTKSMSAAAATATVAKAGAAVKKAASTVAKAVKKAVKQVRKAAVKKKKTRAKAPAARKAKAKSPARRAKAKRPVAGKARAKSRARPKARSVTRKTARKAPARKSRRTTRARTKRR